MKYKKIRITLHSGEVLIEKNCDFLQAVDRIAKRGYSPENIKSIENF